jgi:hypothetical protein
LAIFGLKKSGVLEKIINPRSDNKAIKLVALLSSPGEKEVIV